MNSDVVNKIRGGYLGLCLGDALGLPHERSNTEYTGQLQTVSHRSQWQGVKQGPPGQVSDDATMTTALLWQIISDKDWIPNHVIQEYLTWANCGLPFMGRNTRNLFHGIKTVSGYYGRKDRLDSNNQSNGSLMRAFPLILLFFYQPQTVFQKAIADTSLSNPNFINQDATLIYLLILKSILDGKTAISALPEIIPQAQTPIIREALSDGFSKRMRMLDGPTKGWVAHALYVAVRAWLFTDTKMPYSEIIEWVIKRGGDTDTNASIAGGVVGLVYGEQTMRNEAVTGQNIQVLLSSNPAMGQIPYPMRYHPSTGLQLLQ
jgi:ADP-ribosyl-[dinitrogen reductase] hydrolase